MIASPSMRLGPPRILWHERVTPSVIFHSQALSRTGDFVLSGVSGMRLTHWMVGGVLGAVGGGSTLIVGVVAVLVLVPGLAWAAREPTRPLGLAGLLVGVGVGTGGLLAAADGRCAAFNATTRGVVQSCSSLDATPYLAVALLLVVAGAVLTVVARRRTNRSTRTAPDVTQ